MSKRGLPTDLRMRHDAHYVEELSGKRHAPIGRLVPLDALDPNPEQPRVEIGDLADLIASIKEKGVLEPLLIKPSNLAGRWMIIAGERRWRASRAAGLREVPCIEMDVDDRAVAEIALIENLQRKDLTAWEEADGLAALCEKFGYTHEEVARKVGKSRTTVTEALSIASLPELIREQCRRADIASKSTLLQIVRQPDLGSMERLLKSIISQGLTRDGARAARRAQQSPNGPRQVDQGSYVYHFSPPGNSYKVTITFRSAVTTTEDVQKALRAALDQLDRKIESGMIKALEKQST